MNLSAKVSILIPVYNREKYISQTIDSAISQTYENIEVIVIDNDSSDHTWEIIEKKQMQDERIIAVKNKINIGPVQNWKMCIDYACGEYAKFLWSDDLLTPNYIEKTLPFLKNEDVGFVFTRTGIFQNDNNVDQEVFAIGKSGLYDSHTYINGVLFGVDYPVSPGCALFRLKDLKENLLVDIPNKVNSDFSIIAIGNDLLIFLLTANKYKRFAFVNEKLSFFRSHKDSISIQSETGKLTLYYNLVSAYFVENYHRELINKMNVNIWISLKKYRQSKKYNLFKIADFYINNPDFSLDYKYLIKRIFKKLKNYMTKIIKK